MFMGIVDTKIWPASHDLAVVYGCKNMYICLVKKGTSAPDFHDDAATRHSDNKDMLRSVELSPCLVCSTYSTDRWSEMMLLINNDTTVSFHRREKKIQSWRGWKGLHRWGLLLLLVFLSYPWPFHHPCLAHTAHIPFYLFFQKNSFPMFWSPILFWRMCKYPIYIFIHRIKGV